MKGCVLELGGKDPMIVLEDATSTSRSPAVWGGFANAGQTCRNRAGLRGARSAKFIEGVVAGPRR